MAENKIGEMGLRRLSELSGSDLDAQKLGDLGLTLLDVLPSILNFKQNGHPKTIS